MSKRRVHLSRISSLHYFKLVFRSVLFIIALVWYIVNKIKYSSIPLDEIEQRPVILGVIWIVFVTEMILRFFPSSLESMGCQKQFKKNYIPTETDVNVKRTPISTYAVALFWILLNALIGVLYFINFIDKGILILISLLYSVCDMICILFFCPFQTWFMKNKCCGSCRIYNWDYAMMFTPLVFIPHYFTWSMLGLALLLLIFWEASVYFHPERFSEQTNKALSCANCKEKLCHHKKQLRHFISVNKEYLILKGNTVVEKAKQKISKRK